MGVHGQRLSQLTGIGASCYCVFSNCEVCCCPFHVMRTCLCHAAVPMLAKEADPKLLLITNGGQGLGEEAFNPEQINEEVSSAPAQFGCHAACHRMCLCNSIWHLSAASVDVALLFPRILTSR